MCASKIRVLQIINTAKIGGGMRHLLSLVKGMDPDRFEVYLATDGDDHLIEQAQETGAHVIPLSMMSSRTNLVPTLKMIRLIQKYNIDLVHMHGTRAGFFGGLACMITRTRCSIYTVHGFSFNKDMNRLGRYGYSRVEWLLTKLNRTLISVSETDRKMAVETGICPSGKIRTIYNGIDLNRFDPSRVNGIVRDGLKIPENQKVVGVINRLVPQKGVEYFLKAAAIISDRRDDVNFLVVGDGELSDSLRGLTRSLGLTDRVLFTGSRHDVEDYYKCLDVFVLSSLWEGQPFALMEALAMGCPTVATRTSGSPEVIEDGVTGILIPPKDEQALADAVVWCLSHPEESAEMARRARESMESRFAEERMVAQTLDVYEQLLRNEL